MPERASMPGEAKLTISMNSLSTSQWRCNQAGRVLRGDRQVGDPTCAGELAERRQEDPVLHRQLPGVIDSGGACIERGR